MGSQKKCGKIRSYFGACGVFLIPFLLCFFFPSPASAFVSHDYPAVYTHQLGRILFFIACIFIISAMVLNRLHRAEGWRYIFSGVIVYTVWNLMVFFGRFEELHIVGETQGWQYFRRHAEVEGMGFLFYFSRLDQIFLDIGMLLSYIGLRELARREGEKVTSSATLLLPVLPILLSNIAGTIIMIVLAVANLSLSLKLFRRNREDAMWNYMLWLSSTYVMYSFSRSIGHILEPVLVATGNVGIWKYIEPIGGSFNNFAFFLMSSVSLFFIGIYKLHLKMLRDEKEIQAINLELTDLNRELVDLVAERTLALMGLTVADKVRNPVMVIGCTCKRILAKEKVSGKIEENLKGIIEECKNLETVVENFEHLMKTRQSLFKYEDINDVIRGVVAFMEKDIDGRGIRFEMQLSAQPLRMNMEKNRLKAAVFHAIKNAVDATPSGGTVAIKTSGDGDKILTTITDTGPGIPADIIEKIFDPFFSTKTHKFGMGLPIVKQIVSEHLGEIGIRSEEGRGTTFFITFPSRWMKHAEMFTNNSIRVSNRSEK